MAKNVCAKCITDPGLQRFINANLDPKSLNSRHCDYCSRLRTVSIACDLDLLVSHIKCCLRHHFTDKPGHGHSQKSLLDATYFMLCYVDFFMNEAGNSATLAMLDIYYKLADRHWEPRDKLSVSESGKYMRSWELFCDNVKYRRRYTIWTLTYDAYFSEANAPISPHKLLQRLYSLLKDNQEELPPDTKIWRARDLEEERILNLPEDFTSPPSDVASPNRMSPRGISMFYGASDEDTAYREVAGAANLSGRMVWCVAFTPRKTLTLLDLTSFRDLPSYFEACELQEIEGERFLHYFQKKLAEPVTRDGSQDLEYVPTQVFTEYVRYEMQSKEGSPFHGIKYTSSWTGEPCYVIFADQSQCLGPPYHQAPLLKYRPNTLQRAGKVDTKVTVTWVKA